MGEVSAQLLATTDAYDAAAELYAEFARDALDPQPLDRAVLAAFAELVQTTEPGLVAELGCGPGQTTAHLRDLGLDVLGVDLSAAMIKLARAAYPGLRFEVADIQALDLAGGSLRGIVSWYSVIHVPPPDLPRYLT